jgi:hypothetical protein
MSKEFQADATKAQATISNSNSAIELIDTIINHPSFKSRVGFVQGALPAWSSDVVDFDNQWERLKAVLTFPQLENLKGLGHMSDKEFGTVVKSAAALDTRSGETNVANELNRIKEVLNNVKIRATLKSQGFSPAEIEAYINSGGSFTNDLGKSVNGLDQFKTAIAIQESGQRYDAIGPATSKGQRAYGKYQVMDFNIPSWTQEALGQSMTPQQFLNSPQAQEAVADYKFRALFNQYGNWQDVASVWFSGRPLSKAGNASDVTGTTVPKYVANITRLMSNA